LAIVVEQEMVYLRHIGVAGLRQSFSKKLNGAR
jgi:hypothetical protein